MTDKEIFDWLQKNQATIKWLEHWPGGAPAKCWWVVTPGVNPFTGKTLRAAVRAAKRARERTLKLKAKKRDP